MTTSDALFLIKLYASMLRRRGVEDTTLTELHHRFPPAGGEQKAMRWLGFMQGCCYALGYYTLEQLKRHSKRMQAGERVALINEIAP